MIDIKLYRGRRLRLAEQMGRGVAVLSTAPERVRNRDAHYPYRFDSYFHYLTGFAEPEAVLVVIAGDEREQPAVLPRQARGARDLGRFPLRAGGGAGGVRLRRGALDHQLDEMLPKLLADQPAMFCDVGENSEWDARLIQWLNAVRAQVRTGIAAPGEIRDVRKLLDEMRLIKDAHELDVMRRAARISAERAPARHAPHAPRPERVRDRGRAAARVPQPRRAGSRLHADRGRRRQRLRAALRGQRRAAAGRRPAADRCRLRAGRLRLRHHPHLPRQRSLQPGAARRLRAGAGRAGGRHRQGRARATPGRIRTTRPCACSCRASSTWVCSRAASTG